MFRDLFSAIWPFKIKWIIALELWVFSIIHADLIKDLDYLVGQNACVTLPVPHFVKIWNLDLVKLLCEFEQVVDFVVR